MTTSYSELRRHGAKPAQNIFSPDKDIEISIVMPCLNECETVGTCVQKALNWLRHTGLRGEVLIADNGSTDNSREIAAELGARVIDVPLKGYGHALMAGISAACGKFIIIGDADDSYDFTDLSPFLIKLREGCDIVQGCRLPSGGGRILPGAMPALHRWWGNPMFSALARIWFGAPVHDIYCGLRGFRKSFYERLNQRCTGMEFATEMVIKASLFNVRIAEVPITLYPDGRKTRAPHLKTFRDGWRTLRFFLMYSPRWLFLIPGILLVCSGMLGYAIAYPGLHFQGMAFDAHTLLFASLAILCGVQSILFAVFTKVFATTEGLLPEDLRFTQLFRYLPLELGLLLSLLTLVGGLACLGWAVNDWRLAGFGPLDYAHEMRLVIPGSTMTALGFQGILSSFFISILGMRRK